MIDGVHHVESYSWQCADPAQFIMLNMKLEGLIDCFVGSFTGTVSFWMIHGGHLQFYTCKSMQHLPEPGYKKLIPVGDNISR